MSRRQVRINDLLRETISELISRQVKDPRLASMVTVTDVDAEEFAGADNTDGGQLAVQVPANADHPSHTTAMEVDWWGTTSGHVSFHRLQRSDPIESDLRHARAHAVPRQIRDLPDSTIWALAVPLEEDVRITWEWEEIAQDVDGFPHPEENLVVQLSDVALHPDPERLRSLAAGNRYARGVATRFVAGERLLKAVRKAFFGPFSVSVMLDSRQSSRHSSENNWKMGLR